MELTHTISVVEVIWVLLVSIGILLTAYVSRNVAKDRQALYARADFIRGGPRDLMANSRLRTERLKFTIMVGYIVIGINAMHYPPPHADTATSPQSVIAGGIFILSTIGMLIDTYLYIQDRGKIMRMLELELDEIPTVGNVILNRDNETGILTVPIKLKIENPVQGHSDIRTAAFDEPAELEQEHDN